ncbi:MAG: GspH/FimT family pseudopilin [Desulforhopalus sp.]|nr:GspH/FimT family pseudopilin [Desulforhopalus sp.]
MINSKGFTLSEVLMTLAIMSVVSAIGAPTLLNFSHRTEFRAEAANLVGWLNCARIEAIKTNSDVVIEANSSGYKIFVDNSRIPGRASDWSKQSDEKQLTHCQIKNGLTLSSNFPNNKARFNGTPGVKAGRFILTDAGGNRIDVVINAVGRVRVEQKQQQLLASNK